MHLARLLYLARTVAATTDLDGSRVDVAWVVNRADERGWEGNRLRSLGGRVAL